MSETVHYQGKVREVLPLEGKTLEETAQTICEKLDIPLSDYTKRWKDGSWVFELSDNQYDKFVMVGDKLYEILEKKDVDPDSDIIRAEDIGNNEFTFELRYYNGGAGFDECLEEAIKKLGK